MIENARVIVNYMLATVFIYIYIHILVFSFFEFLTVNFSHACSCQIFNILKKKKIEGTDGSIQRKSSDPGSARILLKDFFIS